MESVPPPTEYLQERQLAHERRGEWTYLATDSAVMLASEGGEDGLAVKAVRRGVVVDPPGLGLVGQALRGQLESGGERRTSVRIRLKMVATAAEGRETAEESTERASSCVCSRGKPGIAVVAGTTSTGAGVLYSRDLSLGNIAHAASAREKRERQLLHLGLPHGDDTSCRLAARAGGARAHHHSHAAPVVGAGPRAPTRSPHPEPTASSRTAGKCWRGLDLARAAQANHRRAPEAQGTLTVRSCRSSTPTAMLRPMRDGMVSRNLTDAPPAIGLHLPRAPA